MNLSLRFFKTCVSGLAATALVLVQVVPVQAQFGFTLPNLPGAPVETTPGPGNPEARTQLEAEFARLAAQRASLPRGDFDPVAFAALLDEDPYAPFNFVRDAVAYEPYLGVLRHAEGALMSLAGNAYDQALLLAALLRARGIDVRFVRAGVDEETALQLLGNAVRPSPLRRLQSLDPRDQATVLDAEMMADAAAGDVLGDAVIFHEAFADNIDAGLAFARNVLVAALPGEGFGAAPSDPAILQAARDHAWVQANIDGQWVDLDPAARWLPGGARLAEPTWTGDAFPPSLHYRLTGRLLLHASGATDAVPVLAFDEALDRAVNDFAIVFLPEGGTAAAAGPFSLAWPTFRLNGRVSLGEPFSLDGEVLARDPAMRAADAVAEPLEDAFDLFGNALAPIGGGSAAPAADKLPLTMIALHMQIIGPQGVVADINRELVHNRGRSTAEEQRADLRRQMASIETGIASGSRTTTNFAMDIALASLAASRDAMLAAVDGADSAAGMDGPAAATTAFPLPALAWLHTRSVLLDTNITRNHRGVVAHAAIPQVVRFRAEGGADGISATFDIMQNRIAAWKPWREVGAAGEAELVALEQGILDTLTEYQLLGGGEVASAYSVVARAVTEGVALAVLQPGDVEPLAAMKMNDTERAAITRDLTDGYAVLFPANPVVLGGEPRFAWWRVDPATGETLGIAGAGEGQAATERIIQTAAITAAMATFCAYESYQGSQSFLGCMARSAVFMVAFMGVTMLFVRGFAFVAGLSGRGVLVSGGAIGSAMAAGRSLRPRPVEAPGASGGAPILPRRGPNGDLIPDLPWDNVMTPAYDSAGIPKPAVEPPPGGLARPNPAGERPAPGEPGFRSAITEPAPGTLPGESSFSPNTTPPPATVQLPPRLQEVLDIGAGDPGAGSAGWRQGQARWAERLYGELTPAERVRAEEVAVQAEAIGVDGPAAWKHATYHAPRVDTAAPQLVAEAALEFPTRPVTPQEFARATGTSDAAARQALEAASARTGVPLTADGGVPPPRSH